MSAKAVAEFEAADKLVQELDALLHAEVEASGKEQEKAGTQTKWLFALAVLVTVIVVAPLTWLNMVAICKPLAEAQRMALAIAGGDLSQTIHTEGRDEAADLQRALAEMQRGLSALVAQVRDASGNIATASQEIASGNHDLSSRTEQTASNVQSTVGSLEQLTATVQQTASSSQTANQLSVSASGIATRGGAVVQQAVASMHEISASSRKIGDIIGLIDSIAFQTNILALNAAVEAARAGEQGRGFAVVASEVRALAGRSADAAKEIKELIGSSVERVGKGTELVNAAGQTMEEAVAAIQRVTTLITDISAASAEQSSGMGQIGEAVQHMDQTTQQNAAMVEELSAAARSLQEQAQQQVKIIGMFTLSNESGGSPAPVAHAHQSRLTLRPAQPLLAS